MVNDLFGIFNYPIFEFRELPKDYLTFDLKELTSFSLPNVFVQGGSTDELSALYELDAPSIAIKIKNIIANEK